MWRVFYYNYWLYITIAFHFNCQFQATQILLSSLYFYSGLTKLVKKSFYQYVAPVTMAPLIDIIEYVLPRFVENNRELVVKLVAGFGVGSEMMLGVVFALYSLGFQIHSVIMSLALFFNLFLLHLYIVVFIGYRNNVKTFWSWNAMCAVLSQIVFSPYISSPHPITNTFNLYLLFGVVLLSIYPLTVFLGNGWCLDATMAHAYFVSGWFGHSFMLVPSHTQHKIPRKINNTLLPRFSHASSSNILSVCVDVILNSPKYQTWQSRIKLLKQLSMRRRKKNLNLKLIFFYILFSQYRNFKSFFGK